MFKISKKARRLSEHEKLQYRMDGFIAGLPVFDSEAKKDLNDFNDPESWTNCQTFYDNDGDGNYWFYSSLDGSDNLSANSFSWNGSAFTPDNWVIMGPIDLTNVSDASLAWEVQAPDASYCDENYTMYVGASNDYNDLILSLIHI